MTISNPLIVPSTKEIDERIEAHLTEIKTIRMLRKVAVKIEEKTESESPEK